MPQSTAPRLTIDLGNSRCKFRLWEAERAVLSKSFDLVLDDEFLDATKQWLAAIDPKANVALCAVAEQELESKLAKLLAGFAAFDPLLSHGLELDCESPETVGMDRLFAARGALERVGQSVIVVDCGTALTVDLAAWATLKGGARELTFMGGAIAPGPELLSRSLAQGGARLPKVEANPDAPALGKHTRAALAAGVAVGLRGAARELVTGLMEAANESSLPVVLSGGAMKFLTSGRPLASQVIEEPELVHLGLLAALASSESDRRVGA